MDGKSTHIPYRDSKLTRLLQGKLNDECIFHNRNNQKQAELPYSGIFIKTIRIISRGSNVYICLVFLSPIVLFVCVFFADEFPLSLL